MNKFFLGLATTVAVVSLIANFLLYERWSSNRPIMTVNDEHISRKDLDDRLDYLYTTPLLRQMIWTRLIYQQAVAEGVMPTDKDVDDAMKQIQRTEPQVVQNAYKNDPTLVVFREDLKTNLAIRNLRVKNVTVTDAELQRYYQANKARFTLPEQTSTTLVVAQDKIGAGTAMRLLQHNFDPNVIAQEPGLGVVGVNVQVNQPLPASLGREVMTMRPGEVKIIPIGKSFAVVKVKSVNPQGVPDFDTIKDQVILAAKLAKAPPETAILKEIRSKAHIAADVPKYAIAIPSADPGPTGG